MLTKTEIETMSIEECEELALKLWSKALSLRENEPLTEEQKQELDRRLEYSLQHPDSGRPWEEVMAELEAKYAKV